MTAGYVPCSCPAVVNSYGERETRRSPDCHQHSDTVSIMATIQDAAKRGTASIRRRFPRNPDPIVTPDEIHTAVSRARWASDPVTVEIARRCTEMRASTWHPPGGVDKATFNRVVQVVCTELCDERTWADRQRLAGLTEPNGAA